LTPELPSTIGKTGRMISPFGDISRFEVIDEIRIASLEGQMITVFQRLEFEHGEKSFRLGYYIVGKKPRALGRWVWGQFALIIPTEDFRALIDEARAKGWL
jgi:hypothetical protein